jgi:hypothetical protein
MHSYLSQNSNEITILLHLIVGTILLLLIVTMYFAYERRGNSSDSASIKLAILPCQLDDLIFWTGYISIPGFLMTLILAPSHLLLISGFEFSLVGLLLSYLFENNLGSVVREKKTLENGQERSSYQLTQVNYCFLYTIVGISLLIAGIVLGIALFSA